MQKTFLDCVVKSKLNQPRNFTDTRNNLNFEVNQNAQKFLFYVITSEKSAIL